MRPITLKQATGEKIGTVTAISLPTEFQFQVSPEVRRPHVQDFVVIAHPEEKDMPMLAKIIKISRFNPLLPEEATLELAQLMTEPELSPMPMMGKMEMVSAICRVMGYLEKGKLREPGFPVRPGDSVYIPSPKFLETILSGTTPHDDLNVGHLRFREDVKVTINANEILNKHLAILAMTGAGKTYTVSVIIEELMKMGYPILVIDPHGDYTKIGKRQGNGQFKYQTSAGSKGNYEVTVINKVLDPKQLSREQFIDFVSGLSGEPVSGPQRDVLRISYEKYFKEGFENIIGALELGRPEIPGGAATINAVHRQVEVANMVLADTDATLKVKDVTDALGIGRGVVLNMSMVPASAQTATVQVLLDQLFNYRKDYIIHPDGKKAFPPVFVVIEEAHNYAPSFVQEEMLLPSRTTLRKIATEGRKFGFSLCIVTQRPSRLDSTVLSQCNSQIILRVVNPEDQRYIRQTVESLAETDLWILPDLTQGEALLSGSMISIPSVVQVRLRESEESIKAVDRVKEIDEFLEGEGRRVA